MSARALPAMIEAPFASLEDALSALSGEPHPHYRLQRVSGGCIHDSAVCSLASGERYFVKHNHPREYANFIHEAQGLLALVQSQQIAVAQPLALGRNAQEAFLVLAYIAAGAAQKYTWSRLGEQLARMHLHSSAAQFGWHEDNVIGANQQRNAWCDDWIECFASTRLAPQLAQARGSLPRATAERIEQIIDTLSERLLPPPRPQLIHGDLWSGNVMINAVGEGVLIDPAVYYGHGEADVAMTQLFAGFPRAFYQGYQRVNPLAEGFAVRAHIYNLYHLLNHLNLFGASYLTAITQSAHVILELH